MYNMAQQQIHDTKNKLEKAVLVGVHAQDDKQFNFESNGGIIIFIRDLPT